MRSTISTDCATAPRSLHDHFPAASWTRRPVALEYPQGPQLSQVPSPLSQRMGRRANLLSLQTLGRLVHGCAAETRFVRPQTLAPSSRVALVT